MAKLITLLSLFLIACGQGQDSSQITAYDDKIRAWQAMEMENPTKKQAKPFELTDNHIEFFVRSFNLHYDREPKGINEFRTSWEVELNKSDNDCEDLAAFYYRKLRDADYFDDDDLFILLFDTGASSDHVAVCYKSQQGPWMVIDHAVEDVAMVYTLEQYLKMFDVIIIGAYNLFDIWSGDEVLDKINFDT